MREIEAKERTKEREDKESLERSLSKDNNYSYCGSGEIPVRISVEDDPVAIAVTGGDRMGGAAGGKIFEVRFVQC